METSKSFLLKNAEHLVVKLYTEDDIQYYRAYYSGDKGNQGFEGDRGEVKEGETLYSIAEELEMWLNDNISTPCYSPVICTVCGFDLDIHGFRY